MCSVGEIVAPAETADEHASLQAEAEEAFLYIWAPTVPTVPLDIGYGCGVRDG
jgi:hypothetical protein